MRTISLHNIRYESHENGGRLWREKDGGEVVVGSVFRVAETGRWQAWYEGSLAGSFETEELAREVLETLGKQDLWWI